MAIHITGAPCCWGVDDVKNPYLPPWKKVLEEAMLNGKYLIGGAKFVSCDVHEIKLPYLEKFLKKYPHFVRG